MQGPDSRGSISALLRSRHGAGVAHVYWVAKAIAKTHFLGGAPIAHQLKVCQLSLDFQVYLTADGFFVFCHLLVSLLGELY